MKNFSDAISFGGVIAIVVGCALFLVEFLRGPLLSVAGSDLWLSVLMEVGGLVIILMSTVALTFFEWDGKRSRWWNNLRRICGASIIMLLLSLVLFVTDNLFSHGSNLMYIMRFAAIGSASLFSSVIGLIILYQPDPENAES